MEQVLDIYHRPYDPARPVICMDEQPKQLIEHVQPPLPRQSGSAGKQDYEYIRRGVCCVWMFNEPLGGWRDVRVTPTKTAIDWAQQVRQLVDDQRYAAAAKITLVCDNLNTHTMASFYKAFPPQEAHRLARKIELIHTPKHGSWLNTAECELSVLTRQCLAGRIPQLETIHSEASAWTAARNTRQTGIDWHCTTTDARVKLKRLYPKILE
jgi:hypothetical protein